MISMADATEASSDAQITFKVKTSSEGSHTITMAESATVLDLKNKLSGEDFENIPVDRQRLIYSGRVMKNDDALSVYKIKTNNTVHMVKSAASNPRQPAATASTPAAPAVPTNMASGTANNPLAGLTGARYAGHQINLPGMDMFGPDGGMGPPMDEERLQRMMSDPNVQQSMNEALNNPDFVNMLIDSNPMLRNMPNAREIITSPFMRQMMSNPQMMSQAMRMQRGMRGGDSAFPAPGATDTTPEDAAANDNSGGAGGQPNANLFNPFMNPFLGGAGAGAGAGAGGPGQVNLAQMLQALNGVRSPQPGANTTPGANPSATEGQGATTGQGATQGSGSPPPANPFAALFPPPGGDQANPFGINPETMQQMMQLLGGAGGGAAPPAPPDNRPPEVRYEEQLRQLNDMGFYDFDRNVAALRRSGGSVQGAIEHLLSGS
ncbi:Ubiquitin domain-containing protein [Paramyrothecium foliicola]|nr:Ubiquitin domain-containing protein [Paramyrothecium foliicola]